MYRPRHGSPVARQSSRPRMLRSRLRVHSGCSTCRRRKKKCDERKPVCTNCARLQVACTWITETAVHPQYHLPPRVLVGVSASVLQSLDFFHAISLPALAEYDGTSSWKQTLGYLCPTDLAIQNIAVVLSDQQSLLMGSARHNCGLVDHAYQRALALWRIRLASCTINDTQVVVIGCLLLCLTESLRSTPAAFLLHLRYAVTAVNTASTTAPHIVKSVGRFLGMLQSLCASTWLYCTSPLRLSKGHEEYNTISDTYLHADVEALHVNSDDHQFELCSLSMEFMRVRRAAATQTLTLQPQGASTYTLLQRKATKLMAKLDLDIRPQDCPSLLSNRAGAIVLTQFLHYPQPSNIALGPPPSIVEPVLDNLERMAASMGASSGRCTPQLSLGIGMAQLTAMCLTTTTDDRLRNRALRLLERCPSREGLWDSEHLKGAWISYSRTH